MWDFLLFFALGWYESFFWGTVIRQGSIRVRWQLPRDAYPLILGPVFPLIAVVKRIRIVRGLVARGVLTMVAVCALAWIAIWIALFHDYWFSIWFTGFVGDHGWWSSFFTLNPELWEAFIDSPWIRSTGRTVPAVWTMVFGMPLLLGLAEVAVRLDGWYEDQLAGPNAFPFDLRRRGFKKEKRAPLFLVNVRREAGEAD
jgi:hypothetical protein